MSEPPIQPLPVAQESPEESVAHEREALEDAVGDIGPDSELPVLKQPVEAFGAIPDRPDRPDLPERPD